MARIQDKLWQFLGRVLASVGILIKYIAFGKALAARYHGRKLIYDLEELPDGQEGLLRVYAEVRI